MELRQLRYLVAISEEQNINRAAKRCFVTQPALTQQIKKLEDEFNTSLLIRKGRGIVLSEDGKRLSRHAKNIIKKTDVLKDEFSRPGQERVNQLSIAVVPTFYKILDLNSAYQSSNLSIKLKKMCDEQMGYELRRGLINAGITSVKSDIENTYVRTIAREKMYVVTSNKEKLNEQDYIDINDVNNRPLALLSKEIMQRRYIDEYIENNNLDLKLMLDITSFEDLIRVIKCSNFISIMPYSLMSSIDDAGICKKEIINDDFYREIFLIMDERNKNNEKLDFINNCFSELTKSLH
jgi:DNA-binding transcriptional LysR family regulator